MRQHPRLATPLLSLLTLSFSQFHGALGWINSTVALKAAELIAKPLVTLNLGPHRLGAVKRPSCFPVKINFVRGFCMGAQQGA